MRRRHGDGAVDGVTQRRGEDEGELGTLREAHHPDRVVTGEALAKHLDTPLDVLERNLDESIWQAGTAEVAERECGDTAGGELASGSLGNSSEGAAHEHRESVRPVLGREDHPDGVGTPNLGTPHRTRYTLNHTSPTAGPVGLLRHSVSGLLQ